MKIHFCGPTGANAVDAAVKLCKTATKRGDIITFQGGFHGSTHAAMALTGLVSQKQPIPNPVPGIHFFPYSYCTRCPLNLTPDTCTTNCATYLEHTLTDTNAGLPLPAAVIMEMIQGEGGIIPAQRDFAHRIRTLTKNLGIPLIVDEVQTGCGRTGTWFAFEEYGIDPDVIVASKALSGIGTPVALIIYDRELDTWAPGAHTGTFRGNQLAFAAGTEAIRIIRRDDILTNVTQRGQQITERLTPLHDNPWVTEIRGRGLMWGIEFAHPTTHQPAGKLAATIQTNALHRGLIIEVGGRDDCVIRLMPPLNVTADTIDTACTILLDAITAATTAATTETVQAADLAGGVRPSA
jgi:diaminobutyrate-2-oxoglutarate transaminase